MIIKKLKWLLKTNELLTMIENIYIGRIYTNQGKVLKRQGKESLCVFFIFFLKKKEEIPIYL